jgi:hypothetical protein
MDVLSRVQSRLGPTGLIVAIVALIVALAGTAIAGGLPGLNSKQKTEVKKIAKKFAGKEGAAGPQGPGGAQGPKGDPGAKGDNGAPGAPGKDGEDGACSTVVPECVLPPGGTLAGTWSIDQIGLDVLFLNISFPLKVEPNLFTFADERLEVLGEGAASTLNCPGSYESPEAAPGHMCIYTERIENAVDSGTTFTPDGTTGFIRKFEAPISADRSFGRGTWAVRAPCPESAPTC